MASARGFGGPPGNTNPHGSLYVYIEPQPDGETNLVHVVNPVTSEIISSYIAENGASIQLEPGKHFQVPYPPIAAIPINLPPFLPVSQAAMDPSSQAFIAVPTAVPAMPVFISSTGCMIHGHGLDPTFMPGGPPGMVDHRHSHGPRIGFDRNCGIVCTCGPPALSPPLAVVHPRIISPRSSPDTGAAVATSETENITVPVPGLKAEALNATTIQLTWDHLDGGATYQLHFERKQGSELIYSGSDSSYLLSNLKPGSTHTFKVRGLIGGIVGHFSETVTCQTPPVAPEKPPSVYINKKGKAHFLLKWPPADDGGSPITSYQLEWDEGKKGDFQMVYEGSQRQFKLVHELPPGTSCAVRHRAINKVGSSPYSEPLECFTSGVPPLTPQPPYIYENSANCLYLKWDVLEPGARVEYTLEMDDPEKGYGFLPAYLGSDNEYPVSQLKRNSTYRFRLIATNENGSSKPSSVVELTTLPDVPSRVVGIKTVTVHPRSFSLKWDMPEDTGGVPLSQFEIQIVEKGSSAKETLKSPVREITVDKRSPNHSYNVRISAINLAGNGPWSFPITVTTQAELPHCPQPPVLVKKGKTRLTLAWYPPEYDGGAEITGHYLQFRTKGAPSYNTVYEGMQTEYIVAGLSPGISYEARVRALNRSGVSPWSSPAFFTTDADVPGAPSDLKTTLLPNNHILLEWTAPEDFGSPVTSFVVEQLLKESFFEVCSTKTPQCVIKRNIVPAKLHMFRVQAVNMVGPGHWSEVLSLVMPPDVPPPVQDVQMTEATATSLRIQWKRPYDHGSTINMYQITVKSETTSEVFSSEPMAVSEDETEEFVIENLCPSTDYIIRVLARNELGEGPYGSIRTFRTKNLPPLPPTIELVCTTFNSIKLRWDHTSEHTHDPAIQFVLQVRDPKTRVFHVVYQDSERIFKCGRLTELTEYEFRIKVRNGDGEGEFSPVYRFSTLAQSPPQIKGLRVVQDNTVVGVSWDPLTLSSKEDTVEYILGASPTGSAHWVEVYRGTTTKFVLSDQVPGSRLDFRVCGLRTGPRIADPSGLRGQWSPVVSLTTSMDLEGHKAIRQRRSPLGRAGDASTNSGQIQKSSTPAHATSSVLTIRLVAALIFLGAFLLVLLVAVITGTWMSEETRSLSQ